MLHYFLLFCFAFMATPTRGQSAFNILELMYEQAATIDGFYAEIKKVERVDNSFLTQISSVKLIRSPYKVYIRQLAPKEGVEVLAIDGNDKAVVNLNSFPWINLYLDPYGSLMRRNQHHVVFDSGFDLMIEILKFELADKSKHNRLIQKEDSYWKGKKMHNIQLVNSDYSIINYTVKENEDIDIIANKLHVNAYRLIELNEDVDGYTDVEEGQIIKVPNHYAKSMNLSIDQKLNLPLVIEVFDDKGLYEKYIYNSITINPTFAPDEFNANFDHYNF